jgi:serine/threonine protein kinase
LATVFDCPKCKARLRVEGTVPENRQLRCRKCGATFSSNSVAKTLAETPANGTAEPAESAPPAPPPVAQASTVTSAPSAPKAPPPPVPFAGDLSGTELGGCRIEKKLGQGGMGAVYKAHHLALDIPVAVKVLPPYMAASHPRFVERFVREARAAARIQHQNIVGVMNVGEEKGLNYIVMQFVDGETLQARIAGRERLSPAESVVIAAQLCEALTAAHSHGIIHRDIKPDNIMIDRYGLVRLADLGLAKNLEEDSHLTASGMGMGTPHYMPPEQAANAKNADARSDIYSLGCTLFEMLTGQVPYDGESGFTIMTKHSNDPIPDARALAAEVPAELSAIVRKTMAKRPEERHQSAAELLAELQRVAPQCGSVAAPAPRRVPPTPLKARTRRVLYGAIGAAAVLVIAGAAWHFLPDRKPRAAGEKTSLSATTPATVAPATASSTTTPAATTHPPTAATPSTTLPPPGTASAGGGIRLEDWVPTAGADGEPNRPLTFKDVRHSIANGVLTVHNDLASKRMSIMAQRVRLDGDFDVEMEVRGVAVCAIVDPRQGAANPLNNLRIQLFRPGDMDDGWHKVTLRRRGGSVACKVDEMNLPPIAFLGNRSVQGHLSLTARPNAETQVRNCVITPLPGGAAAGPEAGPAAPDGAPQAEPSGGGPGPRPFPRPRLPRSDRAPGQPPATP